MSGCGWYENVVGTKTWFEQTRMVCTKTWVGKMKKEAVQIKGGARSSVLTLSDVHC